MHAPTMDLLINENEALKNEIKALHQQLILAFTKKELVQVECALFDRYQLCFGGADANQSELCRNLALRVHAATGCNCSIAQGRLKPGASGWTHWGAAHSSRAW